MKKTTLKPHNPKATPPSKTFAKSDFITRKEAISFITGKVITSQGEWRATRDRVSQRFKYAIKKGQLSFPDDQIAFGLLIAWARDINDWKEQLSSSPATFEMGIEETCHVSSSVKDLVLPNTIEACHPLLKTADEKTESLEERLRILTIENSQLKAKASRYDENCRINQKNGGKRYM